MLPISARYKPLIKQIMKQYSEFTEQYVQDICNALNDVGEVMDINTNKPFSPENFDTLTIFLQDYVVRSLDYYTFLNNKGLVNRGRCPYTGQRIDESFPSWSFMKSRRVYVSHEGFKMMQHEDDEEYERIFGYPRPKNNKKAGGSSGCYIATVCYGNENTDEVILLKQYRDNYLSKTWYGRTFIFLYYLVSPSLAKFLKNRNALNNIIKENLLDKIINKIKTL